MASQAVPLDNTAEDWIFLNLDSSGKLIGTLSTFVLDTPEKLKVHLMREKESLERIGRDRGKVGELKIIVILRADRECKYADEIEKNPVLGRIVERHRLTRHRQVDCRIELVHAHEVDGDHEEHDQLQH